MIGFMAFYFGGGTCNKQKVNGLKKGHIKINRHDCFRSFVFCIAKSIGSIDLYGFYCFADIETGSPRSL